MLFSPCTQHEPPRVAIDLDGETPQERPAEDRRDARRRLVLDDGDRHSRGARAAQRDPLGDGELRAPLAALAARVDEVYLHIDLDGLDPRVAPGTYDIPAPGGLSLEELDVILDGLRGLPLAAATIATYNPDRDVDDGALRAALHIIGKLAA